MDVFELRERIGRWEDLHTEFKERIESPDDLASSLVAFANTDGGQLVIGVAGDRTIAGVSDADAQHRHVDNVAYNNCEPPLTVVQESLGVDGKKVVVVNIPKGAQRPYRTNRGRYYIRTTSGRRDALREELLRLFQATESLYYDETPLPTYFPHIAGRISPPGPESGTDQALTSSSSRMVRADCSSHLASKLLTFR